jgi:hypothetical protein
MMAWLTPSGRAIGETVLSGPGQHVANVADLLGGHGRRSPEARAAAAGRAQ